MSRVKIALALFVLTFISLSSARSAHAADIDDPEYWKAGQQEMAKMGSGFLVWESNRTGRWRIWRVNLDGTGLRQISPDDTDEEHFAPHISPDGKQITYQRYPKGWRTYDALKPGKGKVPLHIMNADGKNDRMLVEDSRLYGEDRGVVWIDNQELMYIGPDRMTYRLDIKNDKQTALLNKPATGDDWGYGFLLDPQLRYATTGKPSFSAYDAKTQAIADRKGLGGCQPYFTRDGRWGYWMGGAGGPINRFDLGSGKVTPIIEKNDSRMPKERNYLYFPMISPCSRLFTFAASPNKHDHFGSDYDIFVARLNPSTLEMIGKPVRYTFDSANDRFSDVFLADMELGEHSGKAPYTVAMAPKEKGEWEWSFGDGVKAKGATARHEYSKAGEYEVEARQGERVLRGRVQVLVAQPPQVVAAAARGEKEIVVRFNEPVEFKNLSLKLDKAKVAQWKPGSDGRSLDITLAAKLEGEDKLTLSSVSDRAQKPNVMGSTSLTVRPLSWPLSREGLLYAWETGDRPNLVADAEGVERTYQLKAAGQARFNRNYAMRLGGGSYLVQDANAALLNGLKQGNAMTIEATIMPERFGQSGPARIVTFSTDTGLRNFTLGQEDDKLALRLRTSRADENGVNTQTLFWPLSLTEPQHVVVTYQPGRLIGYLNGKKTFESDKVQGDFSNWSAQNFLFGDEWGGERDWAGTLEGVALYNRVLSAEEAMRSFEQYQSIRTARKTVPQIEVQAKLIGRSKMPTLKEIQPYREALVVYEYEVDRVLSGEYKGKTIRVAHWAILDAKTLPIGEVKVGQSQKLVLERFEDNPQIESIYQADSLPENFDLLPYFDVRF